jgi:hypothetical protein
MLEKQLQNLVLDWLASVGVMAWPNAAVSVFDPRRGKFRKSNNKHHRNGIPDILGVMPCGRMLGIELKRPPPGKRAEKTLWNMCSEDQQDFIEEASRRGALCFVADSLETVQQRIQGSPISVH